MIDVLEFEFSEDGKGVNSITWYCPACTTRMGVEISHKQITGTVDGEEPAHRPARVKRMARWEALHRACVDPEWDALTRAEPQRSPWAFGWSKSSRHAESLLKCPINEKQVEGASTPQDHA